MTRTRSLLPIALAALCLACTSVPPPSTAPLPAPSPTEPESQLEIARPTLILIGLDGFRWDFLKHDVTPTLNRLAALGVHAERLIPSFPSKTFPNHYTIATGLRPGEHGLVANNIWNPRTRETFGLGNRAAVGDGTWYGGEPIWVTAEKAGIPSAPLFWPGSEAEILGIRPSLYLTYDDDMPGNDRVDLLLEWLELPADERPGFLTLYFSDVDTAAHRHGPEPSPGLASALSRVDGAVARLVAGLAQRGLSSSVDLMIVSDHGMSSTSRDRVILLDDYIDVDTARVIDWNPVAALWPDDDKIDEIYHLLADAHPHLAVYRGQDLPERYEFTGHERIAPIIGIADDGWSISSRSNLARCPQCFDGGSHGYDHRLESMGALLIAYGPSFHEGIEIGPIENIHLYNVMCAVLGLEPADNSGDAAWVPKLVKTDANDPS